MKKKRAIVVVSGGINSCLTAHMVMAKYNPLFLHVSFGQKVEKRELKAFKDMSLYFKVKKRFVASFKYLKEMGGSSLTDKSINVSASNNSKNTKIPNSYVPFLNAHFLSIAVSWAEILGIEKIFFGANQGGSLDYPDSTKKYFTTYNKLISEGIKPGANIILETPLINFQKEDIIKKAHAAKLPFHKMWSCYKNNDIACGECDSCIRRLRAFSKADIYDPLEYMVYPKL